MGWGEERRGERSRGDRTGMAPSSLYQSECVHGVCRLERRAIFIRRPSGFNCPEIRRVSFSGALVNV